MGIIEILGIALALAMDAFAIAVTTGMITSDYRFVHGIKMGIFFGGFQFVMPVIGYFLGAAFSEKISAIDHWLAFGLLGLIGGKMILDASKEKSDGETDAAKTAAQTLAASTLFMQAVATSIDALATGVVFALDGTDIWLAAGLIGAVAFALAVLGGRIGKLIGAAFGRWSQLAGGIVLVGIGLKILIQDLWF